MGAPRDCNGIGALHLIDAREGALHVAERGLALHQHARLQVHSLHQPARHLDVERVRQVAPLRVAQPADALPLELEHALHLLGDLGLRLTLCLWRTVHARWRRARRGGGLPLRVGRAALPGLSRWPAAAAAPAASPPASALPGLPRLAWGALRHVVGVCAARLGLVTGVGDVGGFRLVGGGGSGRVARVRGLLVLGHAVVCSGSGALGSPRHVVAGLCVRGLSAEKPGCVRVLEPAPRCRDLLPARLPLRRRGASQPREPGNRGTVPPPET